MSEEQTSWIRDVTEADFQREVIQQSYERPVIVDFWAPWCGPCRMLGPILERLVQERNGAVVLAKINVDDAQNLAMEYAIDSIPAVKGFRNGKAVLQFLGLLPESQLRAFLDRLVPSDTDQLAAQAAKEEATDPKAAERTYRRVLEGDREHEAALVGLARLLIGRKENKEAADLLERVIPHGSQAAEVERLQGLLALRGLTNGLPAETEIKKRLAKEPGNAELLYQRGCLQAEKGDYQAALDDLLAAGAVDKKLALSKVKEAMVQIFHVIGTRSPLADESRDKLTKLLY